MAKRPMWSKRGAVAVLAVAALALTACSGGTGSTDDGETITFWHYFTDRADVLQQLADQYHEETGVTVELELVPGDALGQKFQAAAQSDTLPDISAGWVGAGEVLAAYANDGSVLNLSELEDSEAWFERFVPSTIQGVSFADGNEWDVDPGVYLVPFDTTNMQILYNTTAFEDAGIDAPPTDFDEFVDASQKLRDAGYQPFVSGFAAWPLGSYASMYIDNVVPQDVREAAYSGEGRYDTEEWIGFLDLFAELAKEGVFADGSVGYDMPAAEALFTSGQVGMIFDGSWALGVFTQTNPDFTDYGVFFPPAFGDEEMKIPGGVGSTAFVIGSSPEKDAAVEFLKWMTETEQQRVYSEASFNIPANQEVVDELELSPNIAAFAEGAAFLTPPATSSMQGAVVTTMQAGLQLIIAGTDTAEAVAARMQTALETDQAQ